MVTLYLFCKDLINLDIGSLTDPLIKVYTREEKEPTWSFVGKTETQ